MARELKGWARPRPLRVAFLVGEGENANLTLDGIFPIHTVAGVAVQSDCALRRWPDTAKLLALA